MLDLNDKSLLETRAYVNGRWIAGANAFAVSNPANGEKITDVTDLSVADVSEAIDAAYEAQAEWAAITGKERAALLRSGSILWSRMPMTSQSF